MHYAASLLTGTIVFALLDGLWLGVLMRATYVRQLQTINDGSSSVNWVAAVLTYFVMIAALQVLSVSRATSLSWAFTFGAVAGLAMYGVYDLTNMATLKAWSWHIVVIDILWGTFLCGVVAAAMKAASAFAS